MIIYVETQGFVRPALANGNAKAVIDEIIDANWSAINVLAMEPGDEVDLILLREKFKEFRKNRDWFAYVPTVQEYVKSLPSYGQYVQEKSIF